MFCPEGGAGLGLRWELGAVAGRRPAVQRRNSTAREDAGGVVRTKDVLTGESHHAVDLWNQEVWISSLFSPGSDPVSRTQSAGQSLTDEVVRRSSSDKETGRQILLN